MLYYRPPVAESPSRLLPSDRVRAATDFRNEFRPDATPLAIYALRQGFIQCHRDPGRLNSLLGLVNTGIPLAFQSVFIQLYLFTSPVIWSLEPHETPYNFGLIFSPVPSSLNEPFSSIRLKNSLACALGMSGPVVAVAPETAS